MALRDIVKDGDSTLRKVCRDVTSFDAKLASILDDMLETMMAADGVGLAAPQIGILRRYAICQMTSGEIVELINPVVLQSFGEVTDYEGCLSCPKRFEPVTRPQRVTIRYRDRNGNEIQRTFEDFDARVCCHEMDHLDGVLFYDKAVKKDD